ncbi:MAG: metallophosphoesterase family protein [Lautropia sp.]
MRLAVLSDLHLEFEPFTPPPSLRAADVVVLAGDIDNGVAALQWARDAFPRQRIVQVAGNHEFFGGCWQTVLAELRETARSLDIDFLENDSVDIDGVRFHGATLWTDFELFTVPGRPFALTADQAMLLMQRRMIDFAAVGWQPDPSVEPRTLLPTDTVALHRASRQWLGERLLEPFDGPRVVVTHHLPSWRSVAPAFLKATSNAAFASDLDALVERSALWIHGHTHHSFDYRAGAARVVANPRGYLLRSGDYENPGFDPGRLVTV